MSFRLRIVPRTSSAEDTIRPEWPATGPEMTFATAELAASAEVARLAVLGQDADYITLDVHGRWVEHPGADRFL